MKLYVSCVVALTLALFVSATGFGASSPGGDVLYANNCEVCHGPIEGSSIIKGATAGMIQYAIQKNFGGMGRLSTLSMAERHGIANALVALPTQPIASAGTPAPDPVASLSTEELPPVGVIPTPAQAKPAEPPAFGPPAQSTNGGSGLGLYESKCSGCHGPLASSTKTGATAGRIQMAINANAGGMGFLSTLTATDVLTISITLGGGGGPPTTGSPMTASNVSLSPSAGGTSGSSTYDASCSGCHGPLATSAKKGATVSRIQNAISSNMGGMGSFSSLSAADLQTIAAELGGGTAPGTAPGTASAPVASTVPSGSTVPSSHASAPASPAAAPASLSAASKASPASPALTSSGAALYGSSCAGCHGPLATSAKMGATAALIQAAISGNTGGMGSLASLTPANVQAIAVSLGGAGSAPTLAPAPAAPAGMSGNCASCHPNGVPAGQMGSSGGVGAGGVGGGGNSSVGGNSDDNGGHESGGDD